MKKVLIYKFPIAIMICGLGHIPLYAQNNPTHSSIDLLPVKILQPDNTFKDATVTLNNDIKKNNIVENNSSSDALLPKIVFSKSIDKKPIVNLNDEISFSNIDEGKNTIEITNENSNKYKEEAVLEEVILFTQDNKTLNNKENISNVSKESNIQNNQKELSIKDDVKNLKEKNKTLTTLFINNYFQIDNYIIYDNGSIYIKLEDIEIDAPDLFNALNISEHLQNVENQPYLYIPKEFIKEKSSNVYDINFPSSWFKKQDIDLKKKEQQLKPESITALYGNYRVSTPLNESGQILANADITYANKSGDTITNEVTYRERDSHIVRNKTTYTSYDEETGNRYIFGDIRSESLLGQSSVNVAGARLSTPYYYNKSKNEDNIPSLNINGFSVNPTPIDILLNDRPFDKVQVGSGLYDLNIPLNTLNGDGTISAITYDEVGNPIRVDIPAFQHNSLMKKGHLEYDLSIGAARKNMYSENFNYSGGAVASAAGYYGLTDRISIEGLAQFTKEGNILLGKGYFYPNDRIGLFSLNVGVNDEGEGLVGFKYSKYLNKFNFSIETQQSTGSQFCYNFSFSCLKSEYRTSLSYILPENLGRLSAYYIQRNNSNSLLGDRKSEIANIQWSKRFNKQLNASVNYRHRRYNGETDNGLFFSLTYKFNDFLSAKSKYENYSDNNNFSQNLTLNEQKDKPEYGYGGITYNDNSNITSLNYGANLNKFKYRLYANNTEQGTSSFGSITGGYYYLPEEKTGGLTNETREILGVVKVNNLPEKERAPIRINNSLEGKTDDKGILILKNTGKNLISNIDIDENMIETHLSSGSNSQKIKTPMSGAYKVNFDLGEAPYLIKVNNVNQGVNFILNNIPYVFDDSGYIELHSEGKVILKSGYKVCEIDFKRAVDEYTCDWKIEGSNSNHNEVKNNQDDSDIEILFSN